MDRNRNLIIILIVIILILIIALAGAMVYIFMNQNNNNNNNQIVVDNPANSGNPGYNDILDDVEDATNNMAIETFNSMFTMYEGLDLTGAQIKSLISKVESSNETNTEHIVTLSDEGITDIEQVESDKQYNIELFYDDDGYVNEISITIAGDDEVENPEEPETPIQGSQDMDKLIFNTAFMSYVGNINGDRLNSLLQVIQDSNTKYPEHQITISSNNLSDLNGIASTNIYTITLSYDDDGYISNINIDQHIQ